MTLRYDYNLPWRGVVIGTLFYTGLSALMVHLARDTSGVVYFGLIALSVMFALLAFIAAIRRSLFPRVLELTEDAVLFPHGFPRTRITRIPYTDIIRMKDGPPGPNTSFSMVTGRRSFEIGAARFPSIESYHAARDFACSKASIVMSQGDKSPSGWKLWGFPEPLVRWVEPENWPRYRTSLVTAKPLLPRLAKALWFFIRCLGIICLPWLLLRFFQLPTASTVGFLCLSIPATCFFTLLYWLYTTYPARPTEISFRERGISLFSGKQFADLSYQGFSGWAVVERQFEGSALHILLLQRRARILAYALPDSRSEE